MKEKIFALLLALVLLTLTSCAPSNTAKEDAAKQPEPLNALKVEISDPPVIKTDIDDTQYIVRFDSKLGCSLTYDPIFFAAEDIEDEYLKLQPIGSVVCLAVQSIWENGPFPICVRVTPLDATSVENAIDDMYSSMNLDDTAEETTFGSNNYSATHLTYYTHTDYAVAEIYVTEQNGTVFMVEVCSFYQPPKQLLTHAYAILDSITF